MSFTPSSLHRLEQCPASDALPQARTVTPQGNRGHAIHAFFADAAKLGRDAALERAPDEFRADCMAIDLSLLPASRPDSYAHEVALSYHVDTETSRVLGQNIGRAYPVGPRLMNGTVDVLALTADGEGVFVADTKTGRNVAKAKTNPQIRAYALMAARAYKKTRAHVAIIYVREDGTPYYDRAEFDALDLDEIAVDIRATMDRVDSAKAAVRAGTIPLVTSGDHCRYCPAFHACPAQTSLARQLGGAPEKVEEELVALLDPDTAGKAWQRLRQAKEVLRSIENALHEFARMHPFLTSGGQMVGPVESARESVDGSVAFRVLKEKYGAEIAEQACGFETSKAAINRALKAKGEGKEALEEIRKRGGIVVKTSVTVKEHRAEASAEQALP